MIIVLFMNCGYISGVFMEIKWYWKPCPNPECSNGHFMKVRTDTRIVNYPAYCKKCKTESLITIEPLSRNS